MTKSQAAPVGTGRARWRIGAALCGVLLLLGVTSSVASAQLPDPTDPRNGLAPGVDNPGVAQEGMNLQAHLNKPPGFTSPNFPGTIGDQIVVANSDLAFQGDYAFVGNFNGFNIYDISNPAAPTLRTSVVCPGGQGDLSVYRNLLFMSVEENRAKKDCTLTPAADATTRFRGVRIFDISNLDEPEQVGQVQTCRGSHTHTLVTDRHDKKNVYIYVQGTAGVRPETELAGCEGPAGVRLRRRDRERQGVPAGGDRARGPRRPGLQRAGPEPHQGHPRRGGDDRVRRGPARSLDP